MQLNDTEIAALVVVVEWYDGIEEIALRNGAFAPPFAASTLEMNDGDYVVTIRRSGGWDRTFTLRIDEAEPDLWLFGEDPWGGS